LTSYTWFVLVLFFSFLSHAQLSADDGAGRNLERYPPGGKIARILSGGCLWPAV